MAKRIFLLLIKFYRWGLRPFFPPSCRFYPTCSQYTEEAVLRFGLFKGSLLGLARILKCHPFHPGGYDPVPQNFPPLKKILKKLIPGDPLFSRR